MKRGLVIRIDAVVIFFFLCLPFSFQLTAAIHQERTVFMRIGQGSDLSQMTVYAVAQDKRGFIWIGTQDGLNRYDGYRIRVFKPDPYQKSTLASGFITALHVARSGDLWIGSRRGISCYHQKSESFSNFQHLAQKRGSSGRWTVLDIKEDPDGSL